MKTKLVNENFTANYLDNLLVARGLDTENLDYFYNVPDDSALSNPKLLDNINEGYVLLLEHIHMGSRIALVVDSDVDGFTSSAIIYQYIKKIRPDIEIDYYLHGGKGHGLSDLIEDILHSEKEYHLVILPDAGSNDDTYHSLLKEQGIECLVLDHHIVEADTQMIDNTVIINNQSSSDYPNKDLSGAGVTWQFCRYIDEKAGFDYANDFIDLAALGIVSDMMSVLNLENRYIIHTGFLNVKNYFFQCLCDKQSFSMGNKITPMTVAFYITPLINAMIRVGSMEEKERLFLAFIDGHEMVPCNKRGAKGTLEEVAIESARECTNARAKQNRTLDKAIDELEIKIHKYDLLENKILFMKLEEEDFPPELNGLIAMKLAAKYQRPAIVARLNDEGEVKGSLRGLNESELTSFKNFLEESNYFEFTAGHDNAAGCGILDRNIEPFLAYANKELADVDFGENFYEVNFERMASSSDLSNLIFELMDKEDIYGQHNDEPLIHITNLNVTMEEIRLMGKNQDTIKIEKNGVAYMFFKCKNRLEDFKQYNEMTIDLVGKPNINNWMGNITPQIFVTDFEISDGSLGF